MTRTLTADEIAAALRTNPPLERLIDLQREVQPARDAVRARQAEINQSDSQYVPHGPARLAALAKGVDAALELDREAERLQTELALLDDLERRIVEAIAVRRADDARAAAPPARRKLPGAIATASRALEELEKAIAALGELVAPLSEVAGLPGQPFPLEDDDLVSLLRLRDRVWNLPDPPTLYPPNGTDVLSAVCDLGIDPNRLAGLPPSQQRAAIEDQLSRVTNPLGRDGLRHQIFGRGFFVPSALATWKVRGFPVVTTIERRVRPGTERQH